MNSKERVYLTLNREQVDRIPTNFRATKEIIEKITCAHSTDYFGLLDHYRVDFREIVPPYIGPRQIQNADGTYVDMWGTLRSSPEKGSTVIDSPIKKLEDIEDIDRHQLPSADWFDFSNVGKFCSQFEHYAISTPGIHIEGYHGVFHILTYLVGMEDAMLYLGLKSDLVKKLIAKIMDFYVSYYERLFEAGKGKIDFIFYKDDFGTQQGLMISPNMFKDFFFSPIKRLADLAQSYNAKMILHSCGSVMDIIPDFIEAGIAVLDPIQVSSKNMDIRELKDRFGEKLTFHGGIDVQYLMPKGTIKEIKETVKTTIEVLGENGGYFFSPSHRLQSDTPIENVFALYEAAFEYGSR